MRLTLVTGLLVAAAANTAGAQRFEGRIVTQMFDDGKARGEMVSSYLGSKTRIDMKAGGGPGAFMLIDAAASEWVTVMPEQKMYMKIDLAAMASEGSSKVDPGAAPKIRKTGETETIAGVQCEHYIVTDDRGGTTDICAAKGLGFFGMVGGGTSMMGRKMPGALDMPLEYRELMSTYKDGFQPLRVERVTKGKREKLMEVTAIEKTRPDAALFKIPAGYNEFKMPAGMKGLPGLPKRPPGR